MSYAPFRPRKLSFFNKIIKLIIQVYSLNAISHEAELDGQFAKYGEIRIEPRFNERSQGNNFILSHFFRVCFDKKCDTQQKMIDFLMIT